MNSIAHPQIESKIKLQLHDYGLGEKAVVTTSLREAHELCEKHEDVATTSLIENWIDETERRAWFLSEICKSGPE
jgi:DNA-binding ferritin-like protein